MLNLLYQEDYGLLNGERNEVKKGMRQKGIGHGGEELRTLRITHFQT